MKTLVVGKDVLKPSGGNAGSAKSTQRAVLNGSASLDPINDAQAWHTIEIGDTTSPGVIESIEGFERATEWDLKKGKGAKGATLTLVQAPPCEGRITFILWEPIHFLQWAQFLPLLKYDPDKTEAQAVGIYHPSLADLGINSVVVKKIAPIIHKGKGKYTRTIEFIEWAPPPKSSITTTPTTSEAATLPSVPGDPPDPVAEEQQKEIAALLKQAQEP